MQRNNTHRIYFDTAAATPVRDEVIAVSVDVSGNPGSLHADGRRAHDAVESARESVRDLLHGDTYSVIFVRGGTESCNLAISGVVQAYLRDNPNQIPHIITTPIEHSSVYETILHLERTGAITKSFLPIDANGQVNPSDLRDVLEKNSNTILASVQMVNNETGVIQQIKELSRIMRTYKQKTKTVYPYLHTDAIQAGYTMDIHLESIGADLVSLAGSKMYGPPGSAVLCMRRSLSFKSIFFGGGQEYGVRSGTPVVSDCVGFAESMRCAIVERDEIISGFETVRNQLIIGLRDIDPAIIINTPTEKSSPHILHFSIPGYDSEYAVLFFDAHGISVSSQSACSARTGGVSRVVRALWANIQYDPEHYAHIRVSFLRSVTPGDMATFLDVVRKLYTQNPQK